MSPEAAMARTACIEAVTAKHEAALAAVRESEARLDLARLDSGQRPATSATREAELGAYRAEVKKWKRALVWVRGIGGEQEANEMRCFRGQLGQ